MKKNILLFTSLLVTMLLSQEIHSKVKKKQLKVIGNERTEKNVLFVEVKDILQKELITQADLKEIKRRIWNLRVFSLVEVELIKDTLQIKVVERWTKIPIAKVTGGGGTSYYALGAYDINSFGNYLELGAQYENLNNRNAGVAWFRKPQFLENRNLRVGADIWSINRVRFFFDPIDSEDDGAFTLKRNRINSFLEYRWDNDFYLLGAQYDYQADEISDFGLNDELIDQNNAKGFLPDAQNISRFHSLYFSVGRINYINYLVEGLQAYLRSSIVTVTQEDEKNLNETEFRLNYYSLFKKHFNFAWQFQLNSNNFENIQNLNYLGGFQEVRGYQDGQYFDNVTWRNNIEQRFDVFENKYGVIQAAVFTDQAKEGVDIDDLTNRDEEILLSSGVGVRLISPKIYRFVARIDYAQTHTRSIQRGISFGIQQFF